MLPSPAAVFYTLGCKLNQQETEAIAAAFRDAGFSVHRGEGAAEEGPGAEETAIVLINTCTVTSHSEQKARRIIRRGLTDHPRAPVIVTGCYAQVDQEALEALGREEARERQEPLRLFVVPGKVKDRLLDLPALLVRDSRPPGEDLIRLLGERLPGLILGGPGEGPAGNPSSVPGSVPGSLSRGDLAGRDDDVPGEFSHRSFRFAPPDFQFHSRAFLKVQDGCDHWCAYCRVSLARGRSRSLDREEALARLQALEDRGFSEAVLTGLNLSQYRSRGGGLGSLLQYLLSGTGKIRLRLSSLEPEAFTEEFIYALGNPRIRPHFHLSIQSGSPAILRRMGRIAGIEEILGGIDRLRQVKEDPFLAGDMITGFPGESPEDFALSLDLCRRAGFAWIHAFPFSPRPGTVAWDLKPRVSEWEAGQRVKALLEEGVKGKRNYIHRWQGREVEALILQGAVIPARNHSQGINLQNCRRGLSENYLKLLIIPPEENLTLGARRQGLEREPLPPPGSLVRGRLLSGAEVPAGYDAVARINA